MGLVVIAAIALYLLVAFFVVIVAASCGSKYGKGAARWGWGAAIVMYLIPFWDLLPTVIADRYYCENDAGFFVYKTVDQWQKENPGVMEKLSLADLPEENRIGLDPKDFSGNSNNKKYQLPDGTTLLAYFNGSNELSYVKYEKLDGESGYQLNQRFRYTRKKQGPDLIKISRQEYVVTDIATNEALARQVDFRQSTMGTIWGGGGDSWWKSWFQNDDGCFKTRPEKFPNGGISRYISSLRTDCTPGRDSTKSKYGITVSCH